MWAVLLPPGV